MGEGLFVCVLCVCTCMRAAAGDRKGSGAMQVSGEEGMHTAYSSLVLSERDTQVRSQDGMVVYAGGGSEVQKMQGVRRSTSAR